MRRPRPLILMMIIIFLLSSGSGVFHGTVRAEGSSWEVGLRVGESFNGGDEDFNQYDVVANYALPWDWVWGQVVQVDTNLTTALGVLDGGGDTGMVGSIGFGFTFSPAGGECPFEIRAGSALTLISEDEYGDEDFGGSVQFTHHISLHYWFLDNLSALARVQHMSNAGIYSENPGLEMMLVGLIYRF